jgi:CDP-diacylglycerol--glycerol-3-phosphate 3-phosphatidyltransferase
VPDLREVLPAMIARVRRGWFLPHAFIAAVAMGVKHGLAISGRLPELKESYLRCFSAVVLAIALEFLVLLAFCDVGIPALPLVATLAWVVVGGTVACSQIALVRRADGTLYPKFGISNALTLFRFLNIPFLVGLIIYFPGRPDLLTFGIVVFGVTALSDVVDGRLARLRNRISDFGRIYDPICDIALNAGVCLAAWAAGYLPTWYMALGEARFFLPLVGGAFLFVYSKPSPVRPTITGKATVFVYAVCVGVLFLRELVAATWLHHLGEILLWFSGGMLTLNLVLLVDTGIRRVLKARREA